MIRIISCHQTAFFHLSTHFLAFSLNFGRSFKVQGCESNGHCNICLVVSGAWPHSCLRRSTSISYAAPLYMLHPVCNLLRHLHAIQELVCPFAKLPSRLTAQLCDVKFCRCCYSLQRIIFAGKSVCRTELRKHFLFKRLCWNLAV